MKSNRLNNRALYEKIMRNVSRKLTKQLNEDLFMSSTNKAYILYDGDVLNDKNLSHKQRALCKFIMDLYDGDLIKIYFIRGAYSITDEISEDIENVTNEDINNILQYINNDIGLLVVYNDYNENNVNFVFYNTSKVKERKEKQTYIYSYHNPLDDEHNSLVLTLNGSDMHAKLYNENIIH